MGQIAENIAKIHEKMDAAAKRAGRDPKEVQLIVVSKTIDVDRIKEAVACGEVHLGENKVQEIMDKYEPMGPGIHWHLIGHLQTNKVKYIIDKVDMIHSVDRFHLAQEISKRAVQKGVTMDILLEINMAQEESKFGLAADETEDLVRQIAVLPGIRIRGLMTVAPFVEDPQENRPVFRKMKELLVDINAKKIDNVSMDVLSMGMTNDYEVAIEEGATMIRVGTAVFGARVYPNKN